MSKRESHGKQSLCITLRASSATGGVKCGTTTTTTSYLLSYLLSSFMTSGLLAFVDDMSSSDQVRKGWQIGGRR